MCGIAGTLQLDGSPADPALVARMCDAIRHRGPDDAGLLVEGIVGLGHRRLSIIDLSPAGHQPMTTGDERSVRTTLADLGTTMREESVRPPAVWVVGDVVQVAAADGQPTSVDAASC